MGEESLEEEERRRRRSSRDRAAPSDFSSYKCTYCHGPFYASGIINVSDKELS